MTTMSPITATANPTPEIPSKFTADELIEGLVSADNPLSWDFYEYEFRITNRDDCKHFKPSELRTIIETVILRKKQAAMKDRQAAAKVRGANTKKKSLAKKGGVFQSRRLRNYPDYVIGENGQVVGPSGTELSYRWRDGCPYVKIGGRDRKVFWLLVEVGFQESPADKRARRATAKPSWVGHCNDEAEAKAEDPESYGLDEDGNEIS